MPANQHEYQELSLEDRAETENVVSAGIHGTLEDILRYSNHVLRTGLVVLALVPFIPSSQEASVSQPPRPPEIQIFENHPVPDEHRSDYEKIIQQLEDATKDNTVTDVTR